MISSELSSLLQREVTSQFISDAESCSVSLKKKIYHFLLLLILERLQLQLLLQGLLYFGTPAVRDIRSPLVRATSTSSLQEFMLPKPVASNPICT